MTESPFLTVHRVVSEDTNVADDLRILAKDAPYLKKTDRETIIRAADDLEFSQRTVATLYAGIMERDQALAAVQDRLAKANREIGKPVITLPFTSLSASIHGSRSQ